MVDIFMKGGKSDRNSARLLEQEARPVILYLAGDLDTYQKCASLRTCRASVGRERGSYWVSFHFPLAKEGDGLFGGVLRSGLCVGVCVTGLVNKPTFTGLTYASDYAGLGSSVV